MCREPESNSVKCMRVPGEDDVTFLSNTIVAVSLQQSVSLATAFAKFA